MPLYYITGVSGSGKSSVQENLVRHSFTAYDVDDPKIGSAHNNQSNQTVVMPPVELRTPEWLADHSWRMFRETIEQLKAEPKSQLIFLCGTAANEQEMWNLFDAVFYLDLDEATLRRRIDQRDGNDFGNSEDELRMILDKYKTASQAYKDSDAVVIDATQPIEKVVDDILAKVEE